MNNNTINSLVGTRRSHLARDQAASGSGIGHESGNSD
jgi:hypothetical protein